MAFRAGSWVEVRSKDEVLATLDSEGRLAGMPFMPEMLAYCGRRFQVYKRAHKACDPIFTGQSRRLDGGVHLSLRCSGAAHGDCHAACLIFWHERWLKAVPGPLDDKLAVSPAEGATAAVAAATGGVRTAGCTEADLVRATRADGGVGADAEIRYACQNTALMDFTTPLERRDPRQYVEDLISGNASVGELARGAVFGGLRRFSGTRPVMRVLDAVERATGGTPLPTLERTPRLPATPLADLDLAPGDRVRIRPHPEILSTLDARGRNRGLLFDIEMVPFCGRTYRVRSRVDRFIDERTGRMKTLKTPAYILDDVWCLSRYSFSKMHCPRAIYSWWRGVWLERVDEREPAAIAERREEHLEPSS